MPFPVTLVRFCDPAEWCPTAECCPIYDHTFKFNNDGGGPGTGVKGKIIVDNSKCKIDRTGQIWLNNVQVVSQNEFRSNIPTITKDVTLLANNTLRVRLTCATNACIFVSFTNPYSNRTSYVMGSYGADKKAGGTLSTQTLPG